MANYRKPGFTNVISNQNGKNLSLTEAEFTTKDVTDEHLEDLVIPPNRMVVELIFSSDIGVNTHSRFFYFTNRNITTIEDEIEFQIGIDDVLKDFTKD